MTWYQFWLFLHILVAILAFGPTFAYPIIAAVGQKNPGAMGFALKAIDTIERRMATPLAVVMPILGTILIYVGRWDLWGSEWLVISIALYTVAFFFALFFEGRWTRRLIELTAGAPGGAAAGSGPPPEAASLIAKARAGGIFLSLLVVAVLLLMVWKPGAAVTGVH